MARRRGPLAAAAGLLLAALAAVPLTTSASTPETVPAGTVVFQSNFDTWDGRWTIAGDMHTVWVSNGQLVLGLDKDDAGVIHQGRVETDESFAFTYGTIRARVHFNGPKGGHSAIWAQSFPRGGTVYCPDGCTEIDVGEHFGHDSNVWQNIYWCPCEVAADGDTIFQNRKQATDSGPAENWHYYRVDWTPSGYTFIVDGDVTATWNVGLSDKPHMLILSYLVSAWEWPKLDTEHLGQYRTYVDFVQVVANEWTTVDTAPGVAS